MEITNYCFFKIASGVLIGMMIVDIYLILSGILLLIVLAVPTSIIIAGKYFKKRR